MGIYDRAYVRDTARASPLWNLSVTMWLVIINCVIFLVQTFSGTANTVLFNFGHFSTYQAVSRLEVWRLVTCQFLHGDLTHVAFNMFGLWVFGRMVEDQLGRRSYLAFYLVCGICGGLMYLILNLLGYMLSASGSTLRIPGLLFNDPRTPLIGASAGVFGVIFACAVMAPNSVVQLIFPPVQIRMKIFAYVYFGIAALNLLLNGQNAGGDAAHIGGAIAGHFFIRRVHLLRDFFDVLKDSRKPRTKYGDGRSARIAEQSEIDRILDKINTDGRSSLTDVERATLDRASRRLR